MFTNVDVRNIAVQIERNGEETYRAAAKQATDENIAEILLLMADEERRHCQWFEALELEEKNMSAEQQEIASMGRNLLQEMVKSQTFSLELGSLSQADHLDMVFSQCKEFEHDTIDFYQFLKGIIEDSEAVQQVDVIIAEERLHIEQIAKIQGLYGKDANETLLSSEEVERL